MQHFEHVLTFSYVLFWYMFGFTPRVMYQVQWQCVCIAGVFIAGVFIADVFTAGVFIAGVFIAGVFVAGVEAIEAGVCMCVIYHFVASYRVSSPGE